MSVIRAKSVGGKWGFLLVIMGALLLICGESGAQEVTRRIRMHDSTFSVISAVTIDSASTKSVWFPFDIEDDNGRTFRINYTGALTIVGWVDSVAVGYAQQKDSLHVVANLTFIRQASYDTTKASERRVAYQVISTPVAGDSVWVTQQNFNWGANDTNRTYAFSKALNVRACHGLRVDIQNVRGGSRCSVVIEVYVTEEM